MKLFALSLVGSLLIVSCATVPRSKPAQAPWGKTVQAVAILGNGKMSSSIFGRLKTKVGSPLRKEDIKTDLRIFWKEVGLRVEARYKLVRNGIKVEFQEKEDDTRFIWGAGVRSGTGVRGTFPFTKRTLRQETVDVNHIDPNASTIVWECEGNN